MKVIGELTYRERIAMAPGSTARVTVEDVSLADAASTILAEEVFEFDGQQVPISFDLDVDTADLDSRGTYSLRATISDPDGSLRFTTDTSNPVDISQESVDLGMLVLVATGSSNAANASPLHGTWDVIEIDGDPVVEGSAATFVFDPDGTLSGNASCNTYTAEYADDDGKLSIVGDIAITTRACVPDLDAQEAAFLEVLNDLDAYEIVAESTVLVVTSTDGTEVVATR